VECALGRLSKFRPPVRLQHWTAYVQKPSAAPESLDYFDADVHLLVLLYAATAQCSPHQTGVNIIVFATRVFAPLLSGL